MESTLRRFGQADGDLVAPWVAMVDRLRPQQANQIDEAAENLRTLTHCLGRNPELLATLRAAFLRVFAERKQVSLYVSSGLLPSTGFFSETSNRISHRLLPEVLDTAYLKDLLSVVFHRPDDEVWVTGVSDAVWLELIATLVGDETPMVEEDASPLPPAVGEILESLRVLASTRSWCASTRTWKSTSHPFSPRTPNCSITSSITATGGSRPRPCSPMTVT